jgi:hypothetical protein
MGRVLFLGHGGFDPTTGSDVAEVLVPPDTSIKFFSDAGQALVLPAFDSGRSDYLKVVKVWDHFKEAEKPVGSTSALPLSCMWQIVCTRRWKRPA